MHIGKADSHWYMYKQSVYDNSGTSYNSGNNQYSGVFLEMILTFITTSLLIGETFGLSVQKCESLGRINLIEETESVLTCRNVTENVTVEWSVIKKNDNVTYLGTCDKLSPTLNNSDFRVEWNINNTCVLRILRNHRAMAGLIRCSQKKPVAIATSCTVTVEYPAEIGTCRVQTNSEKWELLVSCDINKVYSSENTYSCSWSRQSEKSIFSEITCGHSNLSDYYDSAGLLYKHGTCSYADELGDVGHQTFKVSVTNYLDFMFIYVDTINVYSPEEPVTNCPVYVAEGRSLSCDCLPNSSRPGYPPPVLTWLRLNSSHLQMDHVQSQDAGQNFTCKLTWGRNLTFVKSTQYTIQIANPPKSYPIITGHNTSQLLSVGSTVVISCSATGGKPPVSSVEFSCGKHQSHSDFILHKSENLTQVTVTCNVTINNVSHTDNGTICICRAIWDPDPDLSTLKSSIILLVESQPTQDDNGNSSPKTTQPEVIIGSVIGAVLFATIVICTVIIVMKIRNKSSEMPKTTNADPHYDDIY